MKRSLYVLQAFSTALLLLAASACSQDDTFAPADSASPQGNEPITFLASGLQRHASPATPASRASIDNDWRDITKVAVLINGEAKAYDVTPAADFLTARLSSSDPFRWTDAMTTAEVSIWWPYTDSNQDGTPDTTIPNVVVKANQSADADYAASDYIAALQQQVSFGTPAELQFLHRTAHIIVNLTSETLDLTTASVSFSNLSESNGNPAVIIPHKASDNSYEALVAPQVLTAQTQFVTIVASNGKSYIYELQKETQWQEGHFYTYTITVE